jgi:hypothetical protein
MPPLLTFTHPLKKSSKTTPFRRKTQLHSLILRFRLSQKYFHEKDNFLCDQYKLIISHYNAFFIIGIFEQNH